MKRLIGTLLASACLVQELEGIQQQHAMNWCWAACIQDVLAERGIDTSQEQIVARLTGWLQDTPASTAQVVILLRSYGVGAWVAGRPATRDELLSSLRSGRKLIALARPSGGFVGHFIVLEGTDEESISISDPASGRTRNQSLLDLYFGWRWIDSVVVGESQSATPGSSSPPRSTATPRQVPCIHRIACQHTVPCQHRIPCQHIIWTAFGPQSIHAFDTLHYSDTLHAFDTLHPFDTVYE